MNQQIEYTVLQKNEIENKYFRMCSFSVDFEEMKPKACLQISCQLDGY